MGTVPVVSGGHPELGFDSHPSYAEGSSRQSAGCRVAGRGTRPAASIADRESTLSRQRTSLFFTFQRLGHSHLDHSPR